MGDYDSYDLRQNSSSLFPPEYYIYYLGKEYVMEQIGAQVEYQECPDAPYELFARTGDVGFCSASFEKSSSIGYRTLGHGCLSYRL